MVPQDGLNFHTHRKKDEAGPNDAFWPNSDPDKWVPNVVNVHGISDDTVPYRALMSNAWYHVSVWESLAIYAKANKCKATKGTERKRVEDLNAPDTNLVNDSCNKLKTIEECNTLLPGHEQKCSGRKEARSSLIVFPRKASINTKEPTS